MDIPMCIRYTKASCCIFYITDSAVDVAVFRPKASVRVAALLEIDRSTAQSLWGPPDIHLPSPFTHPTFRLSLSLALHSSNQDTLFVCKQTRKLTHMLNRAI